MKKIFKKMIILTVLTATMTSCSNLDMSPNNSSNLSSQENYDTNFPAQTNPNIEQFETGYPDFGIDVIPEQDYSKIKCYTDKDEYYPDFEKIEITVQNENIGKGFYIYPNPALEKNVDGKWIRINYYPEFYSLENGWGFCGYDGVKDVPYSTCVIIWAEHLKEPLLDGDYRAVVFVGKEIIYAPFKIIKN